MENIEKVVSEFDIDSNLIINTIDSRGGYTEVNVSSLFPNIPKHQAVMGAYMNYLGGGLVGCVIGGAMFMPDDLDKDKLELFNQLMERLKRHAYYHYIEVAFDYDSEEAEPVSTEIMYQHNQRMPVKGY